MRTSMPPNFHPVKGIIILEGMDTETGDPQLISRNLGEVYTWQAVGMLEGEAYRAKVEYAAEVIGDTGEDYDG